MSSTSELLRVMVMLAALAVSSLLSAQTLTEFPVTSGSPAAITVGPDGNIWFTVPAANVIGRITLAGAVTEFPLGGISRLPYSIAAGPDGNLWFTERARAWIGRMGIDGVLNNEYDVSSVFGGGPVDITTGPDGNLWFTESISQVSKLTPSGLQTAFGLYYDGPAGITAGPDGKIWFVTTKSGEAKICSMTLDGVNANYGDYGQLEGLSDIVSGLDGNLWFTERGGIGKITTTGSITQYALPTLPGAPQAIVPARNGNLLVTTGPGNGIAEITPNGLIVSHLVLPTAASYPTSMTIDARGNLWFTELHGNRIGRLTLPTAPRRRSVRH
jgi:streptogramin lyase